MHENDDEATCAETVYSRHNTEVEFRIRMWAIPKTDVLYSWDRHWSTLKKPYCLDPLFSYLNRELYCLSQESLLAKLTCVCHGCTILPYGSATFATGSLMVRCVLIFTHKSSCRANCIRSSLVIQRPSKGEPWKSNEKQNMPQDP